VADHQFLIVRALRAADLPSAGEIPLAPTGFTLREAAAIGVFRGDHLVWAAPCGCAELRVLGRGIARAALLGPPQVIDRADGDHRLLDRCYRALLDYFFIGARATSVLVIKLRDAEGSHVDVLWRLSMALDGRLTISATADGVRLELFGSGRRAELAAAIATRPHAVLKAVVSDMGALVRGRQNPRQQTLAVLVRDVSDAAGPIVPRVAVHFSELPVEEVRQHPRKFGVGLVAAAGDLVGRRQFVGRIEGRIVFQIACQVEPPVLQLLAEEVRSGLAEPVALLTEAHTVVEFRNRSIFAAGLQWLTGWAAGQGIGTLAMLILADNAASLRGSTKAGFRRVGELTLPR